MILSRICSAYEEFLKDEQFFDQCISGTNTEQPKRVKWATATIDILPETKSAGVNTRRLSQRIAKPKTNSTDYFYEHRPKRTSTIQTRSSKTTMNQSNAGVKSKMNSSMSSNNCNGQISQHMNVSKKQVKSFNLHKRMKIDRNAEKKLPDPNAPQHSAEIKPKIVDEEATADDNPKLKLTFINAIISRGDQQAITSLVSESKEEPSPHDSNDLDRNNASHSFIVLDDICVALESNVPKIKDNCNGGSDEPKRKSRRILQRAMTII